MKCEDVVLLMDDFLDRRMGEADALAVRAHLKDCETCSEEHQALIVLRDRVSDLPASIDPPRDLWPEIDARIAAKKIVSLRFDRRMMMAAAAVVLLAGSVVTAYMLGRQQAVSTVTVTPASRPAASDVLLASFAELGVHDYQATRQQLLDALEGRRDELSPATLDIVLTNLHLIDEAMGEIAQALGEDPGNELLTRQLVSTYRRQISLLERVANLPSEA